MKVNLLTDAPRHNLALMKISAWHKANGDQVTLNMPLMPADKTYGSWLFTNSPKYHCDVVGGVGIDPMIRLNGFEIMKPDYDLFGLDYSLGYTWEYCPRKCPFCVVPKIKPERKHYSIWEFHDLKFKKICLLNNNTFSDPKWKETFEEIWDANLVVVDENGYDLRLIDEEKAQALKKTKFEKQIHYAWDLMKNERRILEGLKIAPRGMVYVLVGFNTTIEEDFYRCQKIHDLGHDPYIMPYNGGNRQLRSFKRFIDSRMYRKYKTIKEAWKAYK